jgi:uncharacterized membrane protein YfcA
VQWHIPILMGASAIVIAQIASQLSHKTSPVLLRRAFAYLLFAISFFTILETYI